jgi:hypothetical protein
VIAKVAKTSKRGSKPGERRGGRQKGQKNKKNAALVAAVEASGVTPLDYMLDLMRKPYPEDADALTKVTMDGMRFEAAKAAAPYVHPKLAAIEHSGPEGAPLTVEIVRFGADSASQ